MTEKTKILEYEGRKVFAEEVIPLTKIPVTVQLLARAKKYPATILSAEFYNREDKYFKKFDKDAIEKLQGGLYIDIKENEKRDCGIVHGSFKITGLEEILQFLYDTQSVGDLSVLEWRNITAFDIQDRYVAISPFQFK